MSPTVCRANGEEFPLIEYRGGIQIIQMDTGVGQHVNLKMREVSQEEYDRLMALRVAETEEYQKNRFTPTRKPFCDMCRKEFETTRSLRKHKCKPVI